MSAHSEGPGPGVRLILVLIGFDGRGWRWVASQVWDQDNYHDPEQHYP